METSGAGRERPVMLARGYAAPPDVPSDGSPAVFNL